MGWMFPRSKEATVRTMLNHRDPYIDGPSPAPKPYTPQETSRPTEQKHEVPSVPVVARSSRGVLRSAVQSDDSDEVPAVILPTRSDPKSLSEGVALLNSKIEDLIESMRGLALDVSTLSLLAEKVVESNK